MNELSLVTPPDEEPLSLTSAPAVPVPPQPIVQAKAERVNYALGDKSPGTEKIAQTITSGEEPQFRQNVADDESARLHEERQNLLSIIASQSELSTDDMKLAQHIALSDMTYDPGTILEKKFGDRMADDLTANRPGTDYNNPETFVVRDAAAENFKEREYFQNQYHKLLAEWESTGWLSKGVDYAEHFITGVPSWYRLRHALSQRPGIEFLQGSTLKANIEYLWSLPSAQRHTEFEKAIDYLKSRSMLDAQALAQAMVSFPSSEERNNNFVTLGDYTMGASFLTKLARLRKAAVVEKPSWVTPSVEEVPQVKVETPYKQPKQLEMFPVPQQGSFRFMQNPEQRAPAGPQVRDNLTVRNPASKDRFEYNRLGEPQVIEGRPTGANIRDSLHPNDVSIPHSTPPTELTPTGQFRDKGGRFNRSTEAMRQRELDLGVEPQHQYKLDLSSGGPADPTKDLRIALAEATKASDGPVISPAHVLSATGNIKQAATVGVVRRLTNPLRDDIEDIAESLPTFAAPGTWLKDAKYLSREYAQRLTTTVKAQSADLIAAFKNAPRVARLPQTALAVAKNVAETALQKEYLTRPKFSDHVVNIYHVPAEAHVSNTDTAILRLGKATGEGFDTAAQAETHRRDVFQLGEKEAFIGRQGDAFFVEIPKNLDETHPLVRDALWSPENRTPVSYLRGLTRWFWSADTMLAPFQRGNRKLAQHALQGLRGHAKELEDKVINGLPKNQKKELFQMLEINRDTVHVDDPSKRGVWYKSAGEWEQAFVDKFGRPPTPEQTVAYDTFVRLNDFDYMLRNASVYRDMARQGVESWRIKTADGWTPFFNGKLHDEFPWDIGKKGDADAGIYFYDTSTGKGKFHYKYDMSDADRKLVNDAVKSGEFRVVQVFDPKKHPLEGFAKTAEGQNLKDQVNYVVTNGWDKQALPWNQLEYNAGGHVVYPFQWYVAMPIVREGRLGKMTYFGDNVAFNVSSEAQAKLWADKIDTLRVLWRAGDKNKTAAFLRDHMPAGFDVKRAAQLFTHQDSPFSLDTPVVYKEAGRSTLQTNPLLRSRYDSGNLVDATKNPHDMSNFMDKSFLQDRDLVLNSIDNTGMRLVPAEQLDPFQALHKALNQSLRNVFMNDYKISATEQFFHEFASILRPPEKTLNAFPSYFLYHPEWQAVSSNQHAELAAAKASQQAIVNFLGTQSELGSAVKSFETKVQNAVFHVWGDGAANRLAMEKAPVLAAVTNPVNFLRQVAFHEKLGMFNPAQLLVQGSQMMHAVAVTGVENGVAGITGAFGLRLLAFNPGHLDTVARLMTKMHVPKTGLFGWSEKDFRELFQFTMDSGVMKVAGETVMRDQLDPPLRSKAGRFFLDIGPVFFNEGERMGRLTGVAAAFREFRLKNPTKKIGARERGEIMNRADDLSGNMTRASAAAWQQGILSIPTQFYSWQARMFEQMTTGLVHDVTGGKVGLPGRLTGTEKLRAMATYSILYGAPIGLGSALGGWPLYDSLKEEGIKRGWDLSGKWAEAATEGLMEMAVYYATGKHTNISPRVGPGNNQQLRDIIYGDESVGSVLLGASGSAIGGIIQALAPLYYYTASVVSDTGEFKLKSSDWMIGLRQISTFDNLSKAYAAIQYNHWLTKTGTVVGPADSMDAVLAMLGLTPLDVANTFSARKVLKDEKAFFEKYENEAFKNYRMAAQALIDGRMDDASDYFVRTKTLLDIGNVPWDRRERFYHRVVSLYKTLSDQVKWDLFRNSPTNRHDERLKQYQRQSQ